MITSYDPQHAPDPDEWLALDELDRIVLVMEYHSRFEEEMPNVHLHSTVHSVIENQIALGDEYPVRKTLNRLIREGLNRHDAIHAIGSVLIKYIWEIKTGKNTSEDFSKEYFEEVNQLTAQKWFDEFG
ncbi:MAG: DUF1841 family protein [Balneolaceae bacterium]